MLVTAIMPTRGRAVLASKAVSAFLAQTYRAKQLLILDDADDPAFSYPLILLSGVSYLRIDERLNIAQKRNLLCRLAAGEIICHFDSDDFSAPARIADQVERLQESGRSVTGYSSMVFNDQDSGAFYHYRGDTYGPYALGTSLAYRRDWWKRNPFPETKPTGEDGEFVRTAVNFKQFIGAEGVDLMCARLHSGNTNTRNPDIFTPAARPSFADQL